MSTSKHIDKICAVIVAFAIFLLFLFVNGKCFGLDYYYAKSGYEERIFDTSFVHQIDIVMDDWDEFLESCEKEEYSSCSIVIDGERYGNVGIRAKGNTSLSSVKSLGSQRYSFKIEFDQYESQMSYYGLDKLCLNNLIQDNTMMKDYLVYKMMGEFGVAAPLCSYSYITVNGEDWGLYLTLEGIEDGFLKRNYESTEGNLYKPDSMSFGGGRGNGNDFEMPEFDSPGFSPEGFEMPEDEKEGFEVPEFDSPGFSPEGFEMPEMNGKNFPGGNFGMGSDDVKLKYIDDNPESYSNIFDSAKTEVSDSDEKRLIDSLKDLSNYTNLENVLNMEEVLRYFVVHIFVVNGDSYTGSMIHNYYLYEDDGKMEMIPWDYNLSFGTFMGADASSAVNSDIDSPVSGGNSDDRPMVGWIFSDDEYTKQYHELFTQFLETWIEDGKLNDLIIKTEKMISPYVEKDPTKFCTVEEFKEGVSTLSNFMELRAEAVAKQLSSDSSLVEVGELNLSAMGSMQGGEMKGRNRKEGKMPSALY